LDAQTSAGLRINREKIGGNNGLTIFIERPNLVKQELSTQ